MKIEARNIKPSGVLDYNTSLTEYKEGNMLYSINTRIQNDGYNSVVARELVKGNRYGFAPQAPQVQNRIFRANFDQTHFGGQYGNSYTIKIFYATGVAMGTFVFNTIGSMTVSAILANFTGTFSGLLGAAFTAVSSVDNGDGTGYVDFSITQIPYYNYTITIEAGGYLVSVDTMNDAIDPSVICDEDDPTKTGSWIPVATYDMEGDFFILWTMRKSVPKEVAIVSGVDNGSGEYLITLSEPITYPNMGAVSINGSLYTDGTFIAQVISPTQIRLVGSYYTNDITSGTVVLYPTSLSEFGVATMDDNSNVWTYTRLLRTSQWNIRAEKQPEIGHAENNIFRKSFYWCDHYNPDRVFYYKGDYIEDGALKYISEDGYYDLNGIALDTRLMFNVYDSGITFLEQNVGGALLSGSYRYSGRFYSDEDSVTGNFLEPTNQIPVFSYAGTDMMKIGGDESGTLTSKTNKLKVTFQAGVFKKFELISIMYSGGVQTVYSSGFYNINDNDTSLIVTHSGVEPGSFVLDAGSILGSNTIYDISKTIRGINNRLTRSNVKTTFKNLDLTDWFRTFKHTIKYKLIQSDGWGVGRSHSVTSPCEYQIPENVEKYGGFMFHECYRMMGKVVYKDGTVSDLFWIDDILVDLNTYNIDPAYSDNRRIGNDYAAIGFVLSDNTNNTYIPYIDFSGYNIDYLVDGYSLKSVISKIIIERTDVVREVLGSGFVSPGVVTDMSLLAFFNYVESTNTYSFAVGMYPFITGIMSHYGYIVTDPLYTDTGNTHYDNQRAIAFFNDMSWCTTDEYPEPLAGDKIISYGNPNIIRFNHVYFQGATYEIMNYAEWGSVTNVHTPLVLEVVHGTVLDTVATVFGDVWSNLILPAGYPIPPSFRNRKNIAVRVDGLLTNNSLSPDYGFYLGYYYRGISTYDANYNPDTSKYGNRKDAKGTQKCETIYTDGLNGVVAPNTTSGSFGFHVFTQRNYFMVRDPIPPSYSNVDEFDSFTAIDKRGAVSFHSQNICNIQLHDKKGKDDFYTWAYPAVSLETWFGWMKGFFNLPIYDIGNNYSNKPQTDVVYNKDVIATELPATIFYSDQKPKNSFSDPYRLWKPLNFADLDLTNGEIVHHEIVNKQLFCLQSRSFERREFNTGGRLQTADGSEVILGDGSVLPGLGSEISNIGCQHKFSVVKGRSQGGNDVLYWWNSELSTIVRFGADGTLPLSFVHGLEPFARDNIRWVRGKDSPAIGKGIHGVWNDVNKEVIWTVSGMIKLTEKGYWDDTVVYNFGDAVSFEGIGYACAIENGGWQPNQSPDYWVVIYNDDGTYTEEFTAIFMNSYTLVYSEIQKGGSGFRSFKPVLYGKWKDRYLSYGNLAMYEHETSLVPRGSFYGTQYDGLDVYVISARQGTVEDYGAIRFQTSLEPYEVSFETNNNASSLSRGEFKYREKWYDAPVKFSPAVAPYSFGSKLYGNYIKIGLTYNKAEKQENKGFILKSKIRTRFSNT